MLAEIIGIFTSGGFGAIIGIAGSWITRMEERKQKKLDNEFQLKMAEISLQESKLDRQHELDMADKQRIQAEKEGEIAVDLADSDAFKESIKAASVKTGIKWIDGLQKIMRVLITSALLIFVAFIYRDLSIIVGGIQALPIEKLIDIFIDLIKNIVFMSMVAVGWYFGKRATNSK